MKKNLTNKILLGLTAGLTTASPLLILAQQESTVLSTNVNNEIDENENDGRNDFIDTSPVKPNLANYPQVNFEVGDNIEEVNKIGKEYGENIINFRNGIYKIIDQNVFSIPTIYYLKDSKRIN